MFNIRVGDIFEEVTEGYIMHGCNAQGVMGSGVAAIVKQRYFEAFKVYAQQHPHYILGEVIPAKVTDDLVIINAITQENFGTHQVQVDYHAVEQACRGAKHLANFGMVESKEVHFPFIGAGLAGGDEHTLMTIFDQQFSEGEDSDNASGINGTLWLLPDHPLAAEILSQNNDL
jgi:O-acetyl-ADP-ribose deacetylase (regulator of RNase III)